MIDFKNRAELRAHFGVLRAPVSAAVAADPLKRAREARRVSAHNDQVGRLADVASLSPTADKLAVYAICQQLAGATKYDLSAIRTLARRLDAKAKALEARHELEAMLERRAAA